MKPNDYREVAELVNFSGHVHDPRGGNYYPCTDCYTQSACTQWGCPRDQHDRETAPAKPIPLLIKILLALVCVIALGVVLDRAFDHWPRVVAVVGAV